MSAEIEIDPDLVNACYNLLCTAVNSELIPEMENMQTVVQNLLTTTGGLYMEATSPALQDEFNVFANSMQTMIYEILEFAGMFQDISGGLMSSDTTMAGQINSQVASEGGNSSPAPLNNPPEYPRLSGTSTAQTPLTTGTQT